MHRTNSCNYGNKRVGKTQGNRQAFLFFIEAFLNVTGDNWYKHPQPFPGHVYISKRARQESIGFCILWFCFPSLLVFCGILKRGWRKKSIQGAGTKWVQVIGGSLSGENLKTIIKLTKSCSAFYYPVLTILNNVVNKILLPLQLPFPLELWQFWY